MGFVVSFRVGQVSIGFREALPDFLPGFGSRFGSLEGFLLEFFKIKVIDHESGGDDVILINYFDEWLDAGSLNELLFIDSSFDVSGVAGDSSN